MVILGGMLIRNFMKKLRLDSFLPFFIAKKLRTKNIPPVFFWTNDTGI